MRQKQVKVAIITPCYNAENFINKTYDSVKNQTFKNYRWIVVDDASSDNSLNILKEISINFKKIVILKNKTNKGAAVARNKALDYAVKMNFDLIAFLDIDDQWDHLKLEKSIKYMTTSGANFTYHAYKKSTGSIITPPKNLSYSDILKTCSIPTSTVVIHQKIIKNIRMRKELKRGQDYVFWLDLLKNGLIAQRVDHNISIYNIGHKSLSSNKFKKAISQWRILKKYTSLSLFQRLVCFISYIFYGSKKRFL